MRWDFIIIMDMINKIKKIRMKEGLKLCLNKKLH